MTLAVMTAIIFAFLLADSIVDAIRDTAQAKHKANAQHCSGCACDDTKGAP